MAQCRTEQGQHPPHTGVVLGLKVSKSQHMGEALRSGHVYIQQRHGGMMKHSDFYCDSWSDWLQQKVCSEACS
jgi:hypothetical protein